MLIFLKFCLISVVLWLYFGVRVFFLVVCRLSYIGEFMGGLFFLECYFISCF